MIKEKTMATYKAIITNIDVVQVDADSEEQAIEKIKASLPPRSMANIQIAEEINNECQ